jgi:hypothetical protein
MSLHDPAPRSGKTAPPPLSGPEREKRLRDAARKLAAELGPSTALLLAAEIDEAVAEIVEERGMPVARPDEEGDAR